MNKPSTSITLKTPPEDNAFMERVSKYLTEDALFKKAVFKELTDNDLCKELLKRNLHPDYAKKFYTHEYYSKEQSEEEDNDQAAFTWGLEGVYYLHLSKFGGNAITSMEDPEGATLNRSPIAGNGGRNLVEAIYTALKETPQGQTLAVISKDDWVPFSVNALPVWEANDWKKPTNNKAPENVDLWKKIAREVNDKNILLYAGRTKDDALKTIAKENKKSKIRKTTSKVTVKAATKAEPDAVPLAPDEMPF